MLYNIVIYLFGDLRGKRGGTLRIKINMICMFHNHSLWRVCLLVASISAFVVVIILWPIMLLKAIILNANSWSLLLTTTMSENVIIYNHNWWKVEFLCYNIKLFVFCFVFRVLTNTKRNIINCTLRKVLFGAAKSSRVKEILMSYLMKTDSETGD